MDNHKEAEHGNVDIVTSDNGEHAPFRKDGIPTSSIETEAYKHRVKGVRILK